MIVEIVLSLQTTNNAQVVVDADHYVNCMTNNHYFLAADIVAQVAATKTATTDFRTALNAPTSDTKTDDIASARKTLNRQITNLAAKVLIVANDPKVLDDNRIAIVHSAGMTVKGHTNPGRHTFSVVNGPVSGSIILTAQGGSLTNEWQYTTDLTGFTNKIAIETSSKASTEFSGLKKGTEYAFFHKANLSGGNSAWEGPLFLVIL